MNTIGAADMGSIGKAIFTYAADYKGTAPTLAPAAAASPSTNPHLDPGQPLYQKRALAGWTIWDSGTAPPGFPDGRGPAGLGVLVSTPTSVGTTAVHPAAKGYLEDAKVFFHPVMRDFNISGGAGKGWYNTLFNWGKYRGDNTITYQSALHGNPAYPFSLGINGWYTSGVLGGAIACTVAYRGGDWTPNGDGINYYASGSAGQPGLDNFNQMRIDTNGFNYRILLMGNIVDNQANRQGGQIGYMTGDGSIHATTNSNLICPSSPTGISSGTPPLLTAMSASSAQYKHPTTGQSSATLGQLMPAACYFLEHVELGLY
jgi:hypothetical protein